MIKEYNEWTNYATWRVNLEILGDIEFEETVTAAQLIEIVEDCVFNNTVEKDCLAADYARSFIQQVNFYEIAEGINSELDEQN